MKHRFPKRLTAFVLALLMALSVVVAVPLFAIGASAEEYTGTGTFTQCTGELTSGYYVFGGGSAENVSAINNTVGASWIKFTSTAATNGSITNPDASIVWYYDASVGTFKNGDNYVYWPTTGNTGGVGTKNTPVTVTETATAGVYNITVTATPARMLRLNGTNGYRFYASNTGTNTFYFFKLDESVAACEHANTTDVAEVPADCTTSGYTAGVYCNDCETYTSGHEEIPAAGHNYVDGECTVCHETQPTVLTIDRDAFGDASGYAWHAWTATTTKGDTISGSGFIYGTIATSVQVNGSRDGDYIYNTTPLPGGIVSITLTKASGTDRNFDILTSDTPFDSATAASLKGQATDAKKLVTTEGVTWTFETNHKYFAIVIVDSSAAYLSSIEITYKVCAHANKVDIGTPKPATCTEDGITAGLKCADCGEVIDAQAAIPALGHNFVGGVCTNEGCGEIACDHIDKGITLGEVTKPATCIETGLQEQFCAQCEQPLADKVLDMVAHTIVIEEAIAPTCIEIGWTEGSYCSVCYETLVEQQEVDMVDHDYVDNKCTVCGDIKVTGTHLAHFEFGANGVEEHKDGSEIKSDFNYVNGDYTLALTSPAKVYRNAYDAKGNSALKLGTSSVAASFSFTVPDNVNTVVLYIAGYKANTAKVSVNGTEYTITSKSDEGAYTKIVVDTTTDKTVTLNTLSGGYRAMVNSIEFWGSPAPSIKGVSLNLNKGVTVNVKYDIPAEWLDANPDSYVEFSNGDRFDAKAGVNTYSVTLMATSITGGLTVCLNGNYSDEVEVGLYAYIEKVAGLTADELGISQEKYDALVALLDKIEAYGNATALTTPVDSYEFEAVPDPVVDDPDDVIGTVSAVIGEAANLEINLNTDKIPEGSTVSLSVGDIQLLTDAAPEGFYRIKNLYPTHFDDEITITVKNGETQVASLTFTFNTYLKVLFNTEAAESYRKNFIIATFEYGVAAEAYKAAQ